MSCGVGQRCGLDPALLWLWCRPVAVAPIWPLTWELPCAVGMALKQPKKKKKNLWHLRFPICLESFQDILILLCYPSPLGMMVHQHVLDLYFGMLLWSMYYETKCNEETSSIKCMRLMNIGLLTDCGYKLPQSIDEWDSWNGSAAERRKFISLLLSYG